MTSKRYIGNIITSNPTPPAGPYECSVASGVWSVAEARTYTAAGTWPTAGNQQPGQQAYTSAGSYCWTAPSGVTTVSVVAVGGGGSGGSGLRNDQPDGGGGGGLGYKNNYAVSAGCSYTVVVGSNGVGSANPTTGGGDSYFVNTSTVKGGGGGGSIPNPTAPQPSSPQQSIPPAFNIVGASETNQLADAIGGQAQEPTRAYVVATDVSTAQELDRNIIEGASIG